MLRGEENVRQARKGFRFLSTLKDASAALRYDQDALVNESVSGVAPSAQVMVSVRCNRTDIEHGTGLLRRYMSTVHRSAGSKHCTRITKARRVGQRTE